ncbi:MAG: type IV secretory system conjugative DNA transfer family protein [Chloroflexi bacterium]|nr:type IV secretory system conjugative DNA transfer family protein [Chloroflexota bacterium]OJV99162.1 MAG: hypothetical protein BGO39_17045 [Chloroflexi bacterium 54-19]
MVAGPLLLALAGGLDLATGWLYTFTRHAPADSRPTISLLDCVADQSKRLCSGLVWASSASPKRIVLYPWHGWDFLHQFEPGLFVAFFVLAVLSFSAIGSPNAIRVGKTIISLFPKTRWSKQASTNQGLGLEVKNPKEKAKKTRGENVNDENQLEEAGSIPALKIGSEPDSPLKAWQSSLVLGGYLPRMWESDPGYFYLDREVQPVPYWLTLNMLRTNLVIVAPQGSGKTYSVYRPMLTFMRRSHSVAIFWDSKGDDFDPAYFDYNFDPENPAVSIKLNIFAGQNPTQAGERLAEALIPDLGGDKQYFSNNAKDALAALVAAHNIAYEHNPKLTDLLNYLTDPKKVLNLHDMVLEGQRGPEQYEEALRLASQLQRVMQLADNKNTDVLGSLATALNPLVTGSAAKVVVTNSDEAEEVYTIEELLQKPGLIHLSLPVAKSPRLAPILGRLVLSQFTYAVLSPDCNRQLFKMAAVDEARHFITENVANGMAQARSNNAGYVMALQTLTQIKDDSLLDTIFAVSGTKIVMAGVGEKDARRFSDTFGQLELPYVTHSQGQSRGTTHNNASGYSRGQEYEVFGGNSGSETRSSRNTSHGRGRTSSQSANSLTSTRVRPRFFPAEIRELSQFLAVVESSDAQGRRWFAQVIDMRLGTVNRLENQVLDQLRSLKNLQKRTSQPASGQKDKSQPDKLQAPPADQGQTAGITNGSNNNEPQLKNSDGEVQEIGHAGTGVSPRQPSESEPVKPGPSGRKRFLTVRFLPVETKTSPTNPQSGEVERNEIGEKEQAEKEDTKEAAQACPENTPTGFPGVTGTVSAGHVRELTAQPPTEAGVGEPQSVFEKELEQNDEMPMPEKKTAPLQPQPLAENQEKEALFVQSSFLNKTGAADFEVKAPTPSVTGNKRSLAAMPAPDPIPDEPPASLGQAPGQVPVSISEQELEEEQKAALAPGAAPALKKTRKKRITKVEGEIIPAPVTPVIKESAVEGVESGKTGQKEPAGLL